MQQLLDMYTGPSMNIDTACSSSLEALCLAVEAMLSGRCQAAVVGGVNIMLSALTTSLINKLHMLSPDGACKTWDQSGKAVLRNLSRSGHTVSFGNHSVDQGDILLSST